PFPPQCHFILFFLLSAFDGKSNLFLSDFYFTVGQRDPANVIVKEELAENMEAIPPESTDKDGVEDRQKDVQEANEQLPSEEEKVEELEQPSESQSNDVGFKKVFKFVGFKFTVKKDKTEKSEPVQLLTVKKEAEVAANGAGDHKEVKLEMVEEATESEVTHPAEKIEEEPKNEEWKDESLPEKVAENPSEEEAEGKKEPSKSPESPTNGLVNETASPLRKFFTQGWAGFRKKTSFRKPKEDEQQIPEKEKEEQERDEVVVPSEQSLPQETIESVNKESEVSFEEKVDLSPEEKTKPKSELPKPEPKAPLATEIFDEKLEEEVHVSTTEAEEVKTNEREQMPSSASEQSVEGDGELQSIQPTEEQLKAKGTVCIVVDDHIKRTEQSPEDAAACKSPEGITTEVELLSLQERARVQGSPLKKLFTGTGLKKLSGKKHKGKREETKPGEQVEQIQHLADSPESPEEQKAESSASSPEESTEPPSVERAIDATQVTETEEGVISDVEKKRECVTPWASFKKMVTPKKRVRRLSESDKEEEIDKAKSATLSSTESAVSENQEETKVNGEEQKLEKSTEEPKRKVDTSVSWEALICVGSSKKRARKSSSSDEEVGQRLAQEGQKIDEVGQSKETAPDVILTSSQESDQGQGSSSPEQAGSPSEGEGVSTWESFKRLVTPRRKSKTKMEERTEESVLVSSIEHSTSDIEPGKEETWVSLKKLIPGRRKKKSDGKPEQVCVEEAGEEMRETNEEDSDVPAVVPLSEYEAAEQEKIEAQQATQAEAIREETLDEKRAEKLEDTLIIEQFNEGLVHAVTVTVVEGERAVTSIEERSPSWISATVTESTEQEKDDEQTEQIFETEVVVEKTLVVSKTLPELRKDIGDDTIVSELELTSEALTALEEATEVSCGEEATEVSLAEETTEMVSAVSQLTESPDTTEEVTPVQEVEGTEQNLKELNKQTQEILEEVVERVKLSDEVQMISERTVTGVIIQSVQKIGSEMKDEATVICKETYVTVVKQQEISTEEAKMNLQVVIPGEITDEGAPEVDGSESETHEAKLEMSQEFKRVVDMVPNLESKCMKVTVTEAPLQSEAEDAMLSSESKRTEATAAQSPVQSQGTDISVQSKREHAREALEPKCTEALVDEAPVQSGITEVPVKNEVEDAMLILDSECTEAVATEAPVQSDVTEASVQSEGQDAMLTLESKGTEATVQSEVEGIATEGVMQSEVTEAPVKKEVEGAVLILEAECTETVSSEAPAQSDVTEAAVQNGVEDAVHIVEKECTEALFELMTEVEKDLFESGKLELASGDKLYSTPVQQEILAVQLEDTGSPIPSIESSEAQKASVPVTAAAIEEQIIAETVTSTETSAETLEPLAAVPAKLFPELVQDITIAHSGFEAADRRGEETATVSVSEMTAAMVDGMIEKATSCTQPDLVQKDYVDDKTQGKEQRKPECREKAGEKLVSQHTESPSVTHTEFEKDIVQPVTIESESTKIVLKIIQTAVDKFERTEEPAAVCMASESQQQIKSTDGNQKDINISEVQESVQAHQQLLVKGEKTIEGKEQEFQQPSTVNHTILTQSTEKRAALEQTEDVPLISDMSKEVEIQDSGKIVAVPEDVSSESLAAQNSVIDTSVSEDLSKETRTDQLKLKEKEAGQTVATQEKYMVHQPVEDMKRHTEEDVKEYASCGSPQSKSELTKS
uniref:A-kinase anchoring protein 12 n=1 Tax=Chelonoidis abingdonii TaxID=106734 RepID=A0A8C0IRU0_CHEAB